MEMEFRGGLFEYGVLLMIVGFVLVAVLMVVGPAVMEVVDGYIPPDTSKSHAEKHNMEAGKSQVFTVDDMRKCMDNGGVVETWKNPSNGHWMDICALGPEGDVWGYRCTNNCNEELTGWVEEGTYHQVEEYLIRSGYQVFP